MNIIEIKDPKLNKTDILNQIAAQMDGKVVPDFATIGPEKLRHAVPNRVSLEQGNESSNHEAFIDLMISHQLEEPAFTSEAPIIGPWIVRLRQVWNWMSTKWYVLPIIKQQSDVNGQIAVLLLEMETWMNERNQTIANLEEKVNRLESIITANQLSEK
ncbi:MAG: hypothetical protein GY805_39280 [Chloroflexi bacterium]|nr:hypothetical protein [Chloroflexota bacterium]